MEVDTQSAVPLSSVHQHEVARVLCAQCGTLIEPNNAGLCVPCLRNTVDITESIPKQATVNFCRNCNRYLSPPNSWILAELESRELLAICLRKLKGLKEVRLVDAGFIWTEPHSKRLRLKLTVQKEVLSSTILQQIFEVEFVVVYGQCPECARLAAKNTWRALVQVRQKVDHKRTFLYLEQLILKHGADKDTLSIKEVRDGLDFFYASRQHAAKMVEFLQAVVPVRVKQSEQLISLDIQNATTNYKSTWSVEIAPICKDDLVCLPKKLANALGQMGQLALCTKIGNSIHLFDPITLQHAEITSSAYWRSPFLPLCSCPGGSKEFVTLDLEPTQFPPKTANKGRFLLADAQVAISSSQMDSDQIYHTRTHLGSVLKPGDTVQGYFLENANFNNDAWDDLIRRDVNQSRIPQVILVRKTYPERRKKSKPRKWRLKSIAKEVSGEDAIGLGRQAQSSSSGGGKKFGGGVDQTRAEADYEHFLRDLEEDDELRAAVNLYKAQNKKQKVLATMDMDDDDDDTKSDAGESVGTSASEDEGEDGFPKIQMNELLDDFDQMNIIEEEPKEDEDED